jgi:hypothetical protein
MSQQAEAILAAIGDLPASERDEVVAELLRRVALSDHSTPSDDELLSAADEVFQSLDKRENSER